MAFSYAQVRSSTRKIKDPIHDYITVDPIMARFIDTEHFQRLRNIKQLGTTSYVWPSASHTRFEHCLGVAHLARKMVEHLRTEQPSLGITDRDVVCVVIAGLCHDLGHGPWSHVFDGLFIPKALPGKTWQHEDGSELMFDDLVKTNGIELPENDCLFIKALIAGDPSKCGPHERRFLFEIVANKRNGLDVDKFDYIQRDSRMIGDLNSISIERLIDAARVLEDQICYHVKEADNIYELFRTRVKLHKGYYNHKTAKAIEYMIIDALLAADPHMKIAEQVFDPKRYLHLTDVIMPQIESSEDPKLEEARVILKRIRTRSLYRLVDSKVVEWAHRDIFRSCITPAKIVEEIRKIATSTPSTPTLDSPFDITTELPRESDVIVDFATMHYGMKAQNPLEYVKFYSKHSPNIARKANRGDYSGLMPPIFAEDLLRVYSKKPVFDHIIQQGYRALLAELDRKYDFKDLGPGEELEDLGGLVPPATAPTPPLTEGPSTPRVRVLSRAASLNFGGSTATPFAPNSFTTLPAPTSPTGKFHGKRKRSEDSLPGLPSLSDGGTTEEGFSILFGTPLKKAKAQEPEDESG